MGGVVALARGVGSRVSWQEVGGSLRFWLHFLYHGKKEKKVLKKNLYFPLAAA
jgi:hypothetical protein